MKLYEINDGIATLRDFNVDPETGEILDMPEKDINEMIEVLKLDREEKIENIACLIKEIRVETEAMEKVKRRYESWIKVRRRRMDYLKTYMEMNMLPDEKVKTVRASVFWKKNPDSIQVDFNYLPTAYYKIRDPEANKTAIKEAMDAGKEIPGAWIQEGEKHIEIR